MLAKQKVIEKTKRNLWIRVIMFFIASLLFAINLRIFVKPAGLLPGGLAGVTLLIQQIGVKLFNYEPSYTVINIALNLLPIYVGFKFIGKKFTFLSCIVIVFSSIFVDIIPPVESWTDQMLLYSIFGGIINGVVVSMCLILGGTSGGTDFFSIYLSEQKGKDAWNYILAFNVCVLLISGALFGFVPALYSIIFQYASTQVIHTLYKKYQKSTLFIITDEAHAVYKKIRLTSHHGATLFKGKGTFDGRDVDMVYSVVNTDEVDKIIKEVKELDSNAFINALKTDELNGAFYNRPND